jgi:hypothetical protein
MARPVESVMITFHRVAGWADMPVASSRAVSACSGPNPMASPGRSASPSSVASGTVTFTVPVSQNGGGVPAPAATGAGTGADADTGAES